MQSIQELLFILDLRTAAVSGRSETQRQDLAHLHGPAIAQTPQPAMHIYEDKAPYPLSWPDRQQDRRLINGHNLQSPRIELDSKEIERDSDQPAELLLLLPGPRRVPAAPESNKLEHYIDKPEPEQ